MAVEVGAHVPELVKVGRVHLIVDALRLEGDLQRRAEQGVELGEVPTRSSSSSRAARKASSDCLRSVISCTIPMERMIWPASFR
jgi:hypothetical protein